mmetsp:Transcript_49965/g.83200  ORF Transcript_49965/g.83200 Transcript_49965/m.83200 type:complete len:295 (-) Transcript_49965:179-1063(-)
MALYLSVLLLPSLIASECNHYYQSTDASSTKRPFDICYHSHIDDDTMLGTSWNYVCVPEAEMPDVDLNQTVDGFGVYKQEFGSVGCVAVPGENPETRIVQQPHRIVCNKESPHCDVLRVRQHPIVNATKCSYNESVYAEDIEVIGECDDNGGQSAALYCNKPSSDSDSRDAYFWRNSFFGGLCEEHRLFEASYQFEGCQGDGRTFVSVVECDVNEVGTAPQIAPFEDGVFVTGFVLLLIAILSIVFILLWYCCWFRKGFNGQMRTQMVATNDENAHHDHESDEEDEEQTNITMR